jgi:hypothetical protein
MNKQPNKVIHIYSKQHFNYLYKFINRILAGAI